MLPHRAHPAAALQLIEDLRKQLEHLQLFKLEAEQRRGRSSGAGLQEYSSRARESALEQEVRRLEQVRRPCQGPPSPPPGPCRLRPRVTALTPAG